MEVASTSLEVTLAKYENETLVIGNIIFLQVTAP